MPIINTIQGDLIKQFKNDEYSFIIHGCNCFHTMGSGIAGQIARSFPEALEVDKVTTLFGQREKLGSYTSVDTQFGGIINAYTQFYPGKAPKNVLYAAIETFFNELNKEVSGLPGSREWKIGIPKIGSGIAGGNWQEIHEIIDRVTCNLNIIVVEWVPDVK